MRRRDFCGVTAAAAAAYLPAFRFTAAAAADASPRGDIRALKLSGAETTIESAAVRDLRASLKGTLLSPGEEGYDTARRVWNGMIDKHPALIARCAESADVVRAVTFARERELLLAVRGGGHSFPGYSSCEGGLLIDLSPMRSVVVRPDARTAVAAGGAWGAHVDGATQMHSLVTTLGQISNTGIAGLTLGGGFGWLSRRFGLACDNLLSVELVTADGKVRHLSEHDEPDLFWAIRGGGGNFGVATSFEYRLHPLSPTVIAGHVDFPAAQLKDAIEFYAGLITRSPRELSVDLSLAPDADGKVASQIYVVYSGDEQSAGKVLEPLQRFGKPSQNTIGRQSYLTVQTQFDSPPLNPKREYLKGGFVSEYSPQLVSSVSEQLRLDAGLGMSMYFQSANGAVCDVAQTATAFSHRAVIANMMLGGSWKDSSQDEAGRKSVHETWNKLAPFTEGYYVNLNDADPKGVGGNYGPNYSRLTSIKRQFDPMNLFRLNANIKPA